MLVSSTSMNVAMVTVSAMSQGLTTGALGADAFGADGGGSLTAPHPRDRPTCPGRRQVVRIARKVIFTGTRCTTFT